ncbi:hypothetical protein [Carnobacterium maltaromaticum]|uniref:hypothetical protein n=1 Tax=Carnobacterium maltaromaticum TaxID=2751 RepID=UPI0012F98F01|nr:hypothetical protein [Carnobacterium maltaromaticum]
MKKSIIFGVLTVIIISFATTFYFQHQAFSEQKTTMKSNFAKQQKKSDQQIKELQNKNAELKKTIKTNEEKTNAIQSELDSAKAEKEQTIAASQETAEAPAQQVITPVAPQEETVAPSSSEPEKKEEPKTTMEILREKLGREPNSDDIREYVNNN